jgi:hypothetical protein
VARATTGRATPARARRWQARRRGSGGGCASAHHLCRPVDLVETRRAWKRTRPPRQVTHAEMIECVERDAPIRGRCRKAIGYLRDATSREHRQHHLTHAPPTGARKDSGKKGVGNRGDKGRRRHERTEENAEIASSGDRWLTLGRDRQAGVTGSSPVPPIPGSPGNGAFLCPSVV